MSSSSGDGHFIGIDWGSTNARALLFAPDGRLVGEHDEPLGIRHVPAGGHRAAFDRLTGLRVKLQATAPGKYAHTLKIIGLKTNPPTATLHGNPL